MSTRSVARPTRFPALARRAAVAEQCALGGVSLLLAARLGTVAFAPIGVLFVVNSAAVTLSDFGVGIAALRCPAHQHIASSARRRMRLLNATVLVAGALAGMAVVGDTGVLIAASAAIWWSSSEAFVEKASAINRGRGTRAATAEVIGSVCFAGLAVVFADGTVALAVIGAGLVTKHVLEALIARSHEDVFAREGVTDEIGALWVTQALAFAIANVDYLLVGITLGPSVFSVYSIAFRLAVGVPATVAYVASRTAVAEMASVDGRLAREQQYGRYVKPLFVLGAAAGLAVAVSAPVLASLLGQAMGSGGTDGGGARNRAAVADDRRPGGRARDHRRKRPSPRSVGDPAAARVQPRLRDRVVLRLFRVRGQREHRVDRRRHVAASHRRASRRDRGTLLARTGRGGRVRACDRGDQRLAGTRMSSDVAVVFVNYHSREMIEPRVIRLLANDVPVLVADNSGEFGASHVPSISTGGNVGFGAACNAAVAALPSGIRAVCLHNPDVDIDPDAVLELVGRMTPGVGALAPAIATGGVVRERAAFTTRHPRGRLSSHFVRFEGRTGAARDLAPASRRGGSVARPSIRHRGPPRRRAATPSPRLVGSTSGTSSIRRTWTCGIGSSRPATPTCSHPTSWPPTRARPEAQWIARPASC